MDIMVVVLSLFIFSEAEDKGSDCIPQFRSMHDCFQQHPEVYSRYTDEEEGEEEEEGGSRDPSSTSEESGEQSTSEPSNSSNSSDSSSSVQKQAQ